MNANLRLKLILALLVTLVIVAALAGAVGFAQFHGVTARFSETVLGTASALQAHMQDERQRDLENAAAVIAQNPAFVSYIDQAIQVDPNGQQTVDTASIRDLLDQRRRDADLESVAILDNSGKSIVTSGDAFLPTRSFAPLAAVLAEPENPRQQSGIIDDGTHLHFVTITPLTRGSVVALLLTARAFDDGALRAVAKIAHTDFALVAFAENNTHLAASTFEPAAAQALTALAPRFRGEWLSLAGAGQHAPFEFTLGDNSWSAQVVPAHRGDPTTVLLSLLPQAPRAAVLRAIALPLAVGFGVVALLGIVLLLRHWLRTLGPLATLTDLAERAGRGDYALKVPEPRSPMMGRLARSIGQLFEILDRHRVPPGTPRRRATDSR